MDKKKDLVRMSGLWIQTNKSGRKYMSGILGGMKYLVLPNTEKKSENEPDYHLCVATADAPKGPRTRASGTETSDESDIL